MLTRKNIIRHSGIAALTMIAGAALAQSASVPYPEGYRDWTHVKSMVIEDGHPLYDSFGGIHHLYANDTALAGYLSGEFADGAVIAFDLLEADRAEGALTEGARKVLGVMVRDRTAYAATGGWGFEGWAEGDKGRPVVGAAAGEACYACHTAVEDRGYVFSSFRD